MYRVINYDIDNEIWAETSVLEEAKKIQEDNYYFMTGVQKLQDGRWVDTSGLHEELSEYLSELNK